MFAADNFRLEVFQKTTTVGPPFRRASQLPKFFERQAGLLENIAECSIWNIAGMHSNHGLPSVGMAKKTV